MTPSRLRPVLAQALCCLALAAAAQVTVTEMPADRQLLPRERGAATAQAVVAGEVASGSSTVQVAARIVAGATVLQREDATVAPGGSFRFALDVPVTRVNHRVELVDLRDGSVLASAREVVAGDVYVVNGQSNAVGSFALATPDRDSFLRGYLSNGDWALLQLSNPGEWMGRAANVLSRRHDVPVAVFNYGVGAQRLSWFTDDAADDADNFSTSLADLEAAGVVGRVRALCWFQGEADGWEATVRSYREELTDLFDAYGEAWGAERFYAFQTRPGSCNHPEPYVMEAQRRLDRELPDLTVLSTVNAVHDSCHYPYQGGYRVLGDRLADVISAEVYGAAQPASVYSPNVDSARVTGEREITVYFNEAGDELRVTGAPWGEFRAEGIELAATGGSVSGSRLRLTFDASVRSATGVSYVGHAGPAPAALHNARGVGAFTFHNVPLVRGDGDPGNLPDAELRLRSTQRELVEATGFSATLTLVNAGPTTLVNPVVTVPLPSPVLVYEGGNEAAASVGTFDVASSQWFVPAVGPRDSATLRLNYFVLQGGSPVTIWAEVSSQDNEDEDSRPGNAALNGVGEDDEARIVVGDRSRDCQLSLEAVASDCAGDPADTWSLTLLGSGNAGGNGDLELVAEPAGVAPAPLALNTALNLSLDVPALQSAGQLPRAFVLRRTGDATCATQLPVALPEDCVGVNGSRHAREMSFSIAPNPVQAGQTLRVGLRQNLPPGTRVTLHALTGEALRVGQFAGSDRYDLPTTDLPAGAYVVRVGAAGQLVVVW